MDIHGYMRAHPRASADLIKALLRAESLEAPMGAVRAFMQQKKMSRTRGIPFEFSFADWWAFWSVNDRWSRRGLTKGALMMARIGDVGSYAPGNVYCATPAQNMADAGARKRGKPVRRVALRHRVKRVNRPVETPAGTFSSTAVAAKHFGITADAALKRARSSWKGWRYAPSAVGGEMSTKAKRLPHLWVSRETVFLTPHSHRKTLETEIAKRVYEAFAKHDDRAYLRKLRTAVLSAVSAGISAAIEEYEFLPEARGLKAEVANLQAQAAPKHSPQPQPRPWLSWGRDGLQPAVDGRAPADQSSSRPDSHPARE